MITASPLYGSFLDHSVKIFLRILQDGDPYFISEYTIQQVFYEILRCVVYEGEYCFRCEKLF